MKAVVARLFFAELLAAAVLVTVALNIWNARQAPPTPEEQERWTSTLSPSIPSLQRRLAWPLGATSPRLRVQGLARRDCERNSA